MSDSPSPVYKRVLLKLSGEALKADREYGIDPNFITDLAQQIAEIRTMGVQVGLVIGGGNIFRGASEAAAQMNRSVADSIGMIATVINSLMMQDALEKAGAPTRVLSAVEMRQVCEPYIRRRAIRHMEKGRVVILAGGTGNPYFTTDSAAALRANELDAQALLKATKVDGVYDCDPVKNPNAVKFDKLTHQDAIARNLRVMDTSALSLCRDSGLPIIVFDLSKAGNMRRVILGETVGTTVTS
ncbi:TPA: UMP kinase [Candidatus Sumerlaeota bacterium]|jgi:uridylate kinase|nr:UMP kinase [Candidatus Sumerlaeota bacterium]